VQPFGLYLFVESVHCLLYFEIVFEEHAELLGQYNGVVGSGRERDAYLCLTK
jgi:hypothetical protein